MSCLNSFYRLRRALRNVKDATNSNIFMSNNEDTLISNIRPRGKTYDDNVHQLISAEDLKVKNGYHVTCTMTSIVLLDKGRLTEKMQNECLCYIIIFCTSLWRKHFNRLICIQRNSIQQHSYRPESFTKCLNTLVDPIEILNCFKNFYIIIANDGCRLLFSPNITKILLKGRKC